MKFLKKIYRISFLPNYHATWLLKISQQLKPYKFLNQMVRNRLITKYGIHCGRSSKIGSNLKLPHPLAIVIGEDVEIGDNCIIYHNVTFGTRHSKNQDEFSYPKIGHNTIIYTNVVIIGGISIGNNCVIGANSLVLKDIPDNSIYINGEIKQMGYSND